MLNAMKGNVFIRLLSFYVCVTVGLFLTELTLSKPLEYYLSPYSEYAVQIVFRICNLLVLLLFVQQFHKHCDGISLQQTTLLKPVNVKLVFGFGLLGAGLLSLVALLLFAAGITTHSLTTVAIAEILPLVALLMLAALFEQILLNGVLLVSLMRKIRPEFALLIAGGFFSYLHLSNDHFSLVGAVNTYLAGCLFGVIFLKTQSLWPALAFHLCWNVSQSLIWGFNVSGYAFLSLVSTQSAGHPLLTGGNYGLEGSLVTLAVNAALIWFLLKNTRTPWWRRRNATVLN